MKLIPKWAKSLTKKPTFWCYAEIHRCTHMLKNQPNCYTQCQDCKTIKDKIITQTQLKLF